MNLKVPILALTANLLVSSQVFLYPVLASSDEIQKVEATQTTNESNESSETEARQNPGDISVEIVGEGSGSENQINITQSSSTEVIQGNSVEIVNNIKISANTGDNEASDNKGSVTIKTGDVNISVGVTNQVNTNTVVEDCECESSPVPTPTPQPTITPLPSSPPEDTLTPPSSGGEGGSENSGGGISSNSGESTSGGSGEVLGETLPETGGFSIYYSTAFAIMSLISGIILRLDFRKARKYAKKIKRDIFRKFIYKDQKISGKHINFNLPLPVPRDLYAHYTGISPPPFSSDHFRSFN